MIAATDEHFGRILRCFEEKGMLDNTIVLFFADHGDMMLSHRTRLKGVLPYDELFRVPCILRLPQGEGESGVSRDEMISIVQMPGTLTKLAGIDTADWFPHGDFSALAEGEPFEQTPCFVEEAGEELVFFEHYAAYWGVHPFYGARSRSEKYIRYYGEDMEEFYDLEADPHELANRADDPAYAERKRRLVRLAENWWKRTDGRSFDYYERALFVGG
jgi:arylsulfatase A-like enzyme